MKNLNTKKVAAACVYTFDIKQGKIVKESASMPKPARFLRTPGRNKQYIFTGYFKYGIYNMLNCKKSRTGFAARPAGFPSLERTRCETLLPYPRKWQPNNATMFYATRLRPPLTTE